MTPRDAIESLLSRRRPGASICPSEAARLIDPDGWRALMPAIRSAAADMVAEGAIRVTQRGVAVDPATAKGPVRLVRADGPAAT